MALLTDPDVHFVLASASPRRKQLFSLICENFDIKTSDIDEYIPPKTKPETAVCDLAFQKAAAVSAQITDSLIIGADSIVVLEQQILGKPQNMIEARKMLQSLSGQVHAVYTGFAILDQYSGQNTVDYAKTTVTFRSIADWEIDRYLIAGHPLDKAGGYGIQDEAALFVTGINGCYYNVMGLPVQALFQALKPFLKLKHV
ncbi:septum formation protein Maf [bacterium]|nr:septum formation protein Maf [bacterium]